MDRWGILKKCESNKLVSVFWIYFLNVTKYEEYID